MPAKIVFTEAQVAHIKKRYLETLSTPTVARDLGCSPKTILNLIKELGLPIHSGPRPIYPFEQDGKKRCGMCANLKALGEFKIDYRSGKPRTYCVACHNTNSRKQKLFRDYGMTEEQYLTLAQKQGGVCAICHQPETHKHRNGRTCRLAVDHSHTTGAVRGLLCYTCNVAIGFLYDSPRLCESAAAYLTEAPK